MRKVKAEKNLETELSEIVAADADSGRLESSNMNAWEDGTILLATEHQRLQLAVVEAAKEWAVARNDKSKPRHWRYPVRLLNATAALLQFEAEQKNGNT
jgi:hypothetical protein